jgi:hypothetical protein
MSADRSEKIDVTARALRGLAAMPVPTEEPLRLEVRRERLVRDLGQFAADTFASRSKKGVRAFRMAVAAAIVVAVLLGIGIGNWRAKQWANAHAVPTLLAKEGDVRVAREGRSDIAAGTTPLELAIHDRVETADGRAEVSLVSGAVVELGPMSDLGLGMATRKDDRLDEQIVLVTGKIGVHVPKLGPRSSLQVATPNALVTVHGTVFSVDVRPGWSGERVTTVSVTEGLVSVKSGDREIFLGPGTNWSSVPPLNIAPSPSDPSTAGSRSATDPSSGRPSPSAPGAGGASTLAEENRLFREAIAARRAGDPRRAMELVDRLVAEYPTSPLASEAKAERARAASELSGSSTSVPK